MRVRSSAQRKRSHEGKGVPDWASDGKGSSSRSRVDAPGPVSSMLGTSMMALCSSAESARSATSGAAGRDAASAGAGTAAEAAAGADAGAETRPPCASAGCGEGDAAVGGGVDS